MQADLRGQSQYNSGQWAARGAYNDAQHQYHITHWRHHDGRRCRAYERPCALTRDGCWGREGVKGRGMRDEKRKLWRRCPDSAQQPASKPGRLRRSIHLSLSTSPSSLHHPWPSRPSQLRSQLRGLYIHSRSCRPHPQSGHVWLVRRSIRVIPGLFELTSRIAVLGHVCKVLPLGRTLCSR